MTLVNRTDVILRHYDQQIVDRLMQISLRKGIDFKFNATIERIEKRDDGSLHVAMTGCDDIEADAVLFAVGRKPNTEGLGLEAAGSRSATRARSRSTPTIARRCRRSSRSATSPTACS